MLINGYPLDEEQLKPIIENEKYSLIIAGAGSGKTTTLVGKIKYLIEHEMYKPSEIVCISFTKEAVLHLEQEIFQNTHQKVPCFTFHKLALTILMSHQENYTISKPYLLEEVIDRFFESYCFGNETLQKIVYQKFLFTFSKNEKKWEQILNSKDFLAYKKTLQQFLILFKSHKYTKNDLIHWIKNEKKWKDTLILLYAIDTIYETEKKSIKSIDFDDMLLLATSSLKKKGSPLPYKMLLIDEFQDSSLIRFELIQTLVKLNDASLCVVGDDYQSIYHFSGCDIRLFLNFQKYYPTSKIYKIQKTYRNSQELIELAGSFIQKNKNQISKELQSNQHESHPIVFVYAKNVQKAFLKIIEKIPQNLEILVLGRNNMDQEKYLPSHTHNKEYLIFPKYPNRKIKFLTIHSSKGLESDVVILLNLADDLYGIPSKQKEEEILSLINKRLPYPYEEERRLFYVALTRTKSKVYCIIPRENPSVFVKELKKNKRIQKLYFL